MGAGGHAASSRDPAVVVTPEEKNSCLSLLKSIVRKCSPTVRSQPQHTHTRPLSQSRCTFSEDLDPSCYIPVDGSLVVKPKFQSLLKEFDLIDTSRPKKGQNKGRRNKKNKKKKKKRMKKSRSQKETQPRREG